MDQSFNLEQTSFTIDSMKSTMDTVEVMKMSSKELKRTMGSMKIGKVEDLRDEMEDLMMETSEINEVLSRSYGVPEEIDDCDLEAELGMLADEADFEDLQSTEAKSSSSYLDILTTPSNNNLTSNGGNGGDDENVENDDGNGGDDGGNGGDDGGISGDDCGNFGDDGGTSGEYGGNGGYEEATVWMMVVMVVR